MVAGSAQIGINGVAEVLKSPVLGRAGSSPALGISAITGLQRNEGFAKSAVLGQLTIQNAFSDFCLPILERCDASRQEDRSRGDMS